MLVLANLNGSWPMPYDAPAGPPQLKNLADRNTLVPPGLHWLPAYLIDLPVKQALPCFHLMLLSANALFSSRRLMANPLRTKP